MTTTIRDYINLTKPRIMPLLLIVAFASMFIASNGELAWVAVLATMAGGALAIGAAGAINCYIDRKIDRVMTRTRSRPVPAGRITPRSALLFGLALGAASFALMSSLVNLLAALLTVGAIAYYVVIYSYLLKLSTVQNIVIGGAAGAAPALIGWAAATNGLSLTALILFAIVFYWTPPHFWALALILEKDYRDAGIPMLPAVAGARETKRQIILYTWILLAVTLLLVPASSMGFLYLGAALVLGAIFIALTFILARSSGHRTARAVFSYSMLYLALLFGAMAVDRHLSLIS